MNTICHAALALGLAAAAIGQSRVGLELHHGTGPFHNILAGIVCGPVSCIVGQPAPPTLTVPRGATINAHVYGARQQVFFLGVSVGAACQTIPGIQNEFSLAGAPVVIGGVLPPAGSLCGGNVAAASIWGINVPAGIAPNSQFVFQALTMEAVGPGNFVPTFTNAVVLVAN